MRIIYTAGVWDLLHDGHLRILRASRELGDMLVVGVVTDLGAAAYKPRAPVMSEHVRLELVAALECVDVALLQPGTDPTPVLEALHTLGSTPHVMTHGDDWTELREGGDTLARLDITLELLPYGDGSGTTGIIERIQELGVREEAR